MQLIYKFSFNFGLYWYVTFNQYLSAECLKASEPYGPNFDSQAGISSDLNEWQVAVIMICAMVGLAIILLISLYCKDKRKGKIADSENEEQDNYDLIQNGVVPETKKKQKDIVLVKKTMLPITPIQSHNLQRNAGYYTSGIYKEPLPPIPTTVFMVQLSAPVQQQPQQSKRMEQHV